MEPLGGFLKRCPSCFRNVLNNICDFTCSPHQSSFIRVKEIIDGKCGHGVLAIASRRINWFHMIIDSCYCFRLIYTCIHITFYVCHFDLDHFWAITIDIHIINIWKQKQKLWLFCSFRWRCVWNHALPICNSECAKPTKQHANFIWLKIRKYSKAVAQFVDVLFLVIVCKTSNEMNLLRLAS